MRLLQRLNTRNRLVHCLVVKEIFLISVSLFSGAVPVYVIWSFYLTMAYFILLLLAIQAIETKNHASLNGKPIRVTWSRRDPDARRSGLGNVFVKVSVLLPQYKIIQSEINFLLRYLPC